MLISDFGYLTNCFNNNSKNKSADFTNKYSNHKNLYYNWVVNVISKSKAEICLCKNGMLFKFKKKPSYFCASKNKFSGFDFDKNDYDNYHYIKIKNAN